MATPTPMMRQWQRVKDQYPDALLFFRMGDFYELFHEDARTVARELEITLTSRSKDADAIPMCGVPYHAAERYIAQLLAKGYRCAICDQVEDPKYARGLVKREITRVLSPGTVIEDSFLQSVGAAKGNNFLAALCADKDLQHFGLALVDVSTGEFLAGQIEAEGKVGVQAACAPDEEPIAPGAQDQTPDAAEGHARWFKLREELQRFEPSEVLVPQNLRECAGFLEFLSDNNLHVTAFDSSGFDSSTQKVQNHFRVSSLRGFGLENLPVAQDAAALALDYLKDTHLGALGHIRRISLLSTEGWMMLDNATRRNLELVQSLRDGSSKNTLLALLDETRTGAGARLLRKWILQPLLQRDRILSRQDAVAEMLDNLLLRRDVRDLLRSISDIERLVTRAVAGQANARDLVSLRTALQTLPAMRAALEICAGKALVNVREHLDPAPDLLKLLENALADEPPATLNEGGLIRDEYNDELDTTRIAAREGKVWIAQLEETERARTGIKNLKVGFNNVFGYYIEITKVNIANAPDDYTRKQTTANAERFVTPELKEKEALILGAQDRINDIEKRLFESVRDQVAGQAAPLLTTARALAHLDVYAGLAEVAAKRDFVRPEISEDDILEIRGGRHPVVEAMSEAPFVPNDCVLDSESQQVLIITGPNASGKSTFLRQVALIALLAQIGSFVPARSAKIGLARPHFYARRRAGRPRDRPKYFHRRDERNRQYSQQRHAAQPGDSGRSRARHEHLRRAFDCVGGRRASARKRAENSVRHALSSFERTGRTLAAREKFPHRGQRRRRAHHFPAPHHSRRHRPQLRNSSRALGRFAPKHHSPRAGTVGYFLARALARPKCRGFRRAQSSASTCGRPVR